MYTAKRTPLAKLKAYEAEMNGHYLAALRHRDFTRAREIYDRRWRVRREILRREEWGESSFGTRTAEEMYPAA
ncbi:MAG TPA: hypothetical protein VKX96_05970 [Chloroflexota bacterium]|jgi:hypothetical protein|nr:hypothetical protein [Chloroflexota bacterium]